MGKLRIASVSGEQEAAKEERRRKIDHQAPCIQSELIRIGTVLSEGIVNMGIHTYVCVRACVWVGMGGVTDIIST